MQTLKISNLILKYDYNTELRLVDKKYSYSYFIHMVSNTIIEIDVEKLKHIVNMVSKYFKYLPMYKAVFFPFYHVNGCEKFVDVNRIKFDSDVNSNMFYVCNFKLLMKISKVFDFDINEYWTWVSGCDVDFGLFKYYWYAFECSCFDDEEYFNLVKIQYYVRGKVIEFVRSVIGMELPYVDIYLPKPMDLKIIRNLKFSVRRDYVDMDIIVGYAFFKTVRIAQEYDEIKKSYNDCKKYMKQLEFKK